jgi:hypothetical protein
VCLHSLCRYRGTLAREARSDDEMNRRRRSMDEPNTHGPYQPRNAKRPTNKNGERPEFRAFPDRIEFATKDFAEPSQLADT